MDDNQQSPDDATEATDSTGLAAPDDPDTETETETVELTPDETALHARPEVDPLHERDIPHTEDLQEPEGDNAVPGDSFIPTSNNRIF